jgi:hypothetical protein
MVMTFSEWMRKKRLDELAPIDQQTLIKTIGSLYNTPGAASGTVPPVANALAMNAPTLVAALEDTPAAAKAKELKDKAMKKQNINQQAIPISPAAVQTP